MKIRVGFVSNSSSSSYVCDVCGEDQSGWDMNISEAGMFQCKNEHTICLDHRIGDVVVLSIEEMRQKLLENPDLDDDDREEIKSYEDETVEDEYQEWCDENSYEEEYEADPKFCPICQFKEIKAEEALPYLLSRCGLTKEQFLSEMKEKFQDYDNLLKFNNPDKE